MESPSAKPQYPFHVLLFAASPVLFLFARNTEEVSVSAMLPPLAVSIIAAAVVLALLRLLLRKWATAGIITSLAVLLFFYYMTIYNLFPAISVGPINLGTHRVVIPELLLLFVAAAFFIARTKRDLTVATKVLNTSAIALIAMALFNVGTGMAGPSGKQDGGGDKVAGVTVKAKEAAAAKKNGYPDIYYIIPDSYTSPAILKKFYKYDNSSFYRFLEKKGFFIASHGHSNYGMTYLSLTSSLNMEYLDYIPKTIGEEAQSRRLPLERLRKNRVFKFLKGLGYTIVQTKSGYYVTDSMTTRDIYLDGSLLDEFSSALLENTLAMPVMKRLVTDEKRKTIIYAFDQLEEIPKSIKGPKMVFVHVVAPHPPYVVAADGGPVQDYEKVNSGGDENNYVGYVGQMEYVNKRLKAAVTSILKNSERPPIIIIQGDHGSTTFNGLYDKGTKKYRERMAIMNAYYLPTKEGRDRLYDKITPVNSFRLVLSTYFGADLPLLKDRVYFSAYMRPYKFEDVTDIVAQD